MLRIQLKLFVGNSQLFEQFRQRPALLAFAAEVGHGVKSDIESSSEALVIGVQAAGHLVLLQNTNLLVKHRQPDSGREPRHARADDDGVIMCHIKFQENLGPKYSMQLFMVASFG